MSMTLHQLRIFWTVAHQATLTKASKQLGLAQPSLSQQLSKLEETLGVRLFDRSASQMALTDAGKFLLRKAEGILADVEEAESGLKEYAEGMRGMIHVAGLPMVLRLLVPAAYRHLAQTFPDVEIDLFEVAPWETLDLLYGRRANIGVVAANSIAEINVPFRQVPLVSDPYVLAVPDWLDLSQVTDPERDLPARERAVLNSCIHFSFGTQLTRRVEQWYHAVLPRHRLIAQCRTYDVALSMVQRGLGVCLMPSLTAETGGGVLPGLALYATNQPARRLVALTPSQYAHVEPYASFVAALEKAGREIALPPVHPMPAFIRALDQVLA